MQNIKATQKNLPYGILNADPTSQYDGKWLVIGPDGFSRPLQTCQMNNKESQKAPFCETVISDFCTFKYNDSNGFIQNGKCVNSSGSNVELQNSDGNSWMCDENERRDKINKYQIDYIENKGNYKLQCTGKVSPPPPPPTPPPPPPPPPPSPPSTKCNTNCDNNGGVRWPSPLQHPDFYSNTLLNNIFSIMNYGPADTCNNHNNLDGTVVAQYVNTQECGRLGSMMYFNNPQENKCENNLTRSKLMPSNKVIKKCGNQLPITYKYLTAVNAVYGSDTLDALWASNASPFTTIIKKFKFEQKSYSHSQNKIYYNITTYSKYGKPKYLTWHKQKKFVYFTNSEIYNHQLSSAWGFHNHGNHYNYIIGLNINKLPENDDLNPGNLGFYKNTNKTELTWTSYEISDKHDINLTRYFAGVSIGQENRNTFQKFNNEKTSGFANWSTDIENNLALFYCCN